MNEFIINRPARMHPKDVVPGVMGISLEQLINQIRENRNGQYDCLYRKKAEVAP